MLCIPMCKYIIRTVHVHMYAVCNLNIVCMCFTCTFTYVCIYILYLYLYYEPTYFIVYVTVCTYVHTHTVLHSTLLSLLQLRMYNMYTCGNCYSVLPLRMFICTCAKIYVRTYIIVYLPTYIHTYVMWEFPQCLWISFIYVRLFPLRATT